MGTSVAGRSLQRGLVMSISPAQRMPYRSRKAWKASRACRPPGRFASSSRNAASSGRPSSSTCCRNATTSGCGRITSATSRSASPISDVTLSGTDCVSVSAAFFSPSHSCSWSLSHQTAVIEAMIAWELRGSNRIRLSSGMSARMKSSRAGPDSGRMSRFSAAMEDWVWSICSATIAGSASLGSRGPPTGLMPVGSSGHGRTKPSRSRMVASASPISGSDFPIIPTRAARLPGDASRRVTSTNSLPPASYIRGKAVSWNSESPRGFMGSVIICW